MTTVMEFHRNRDIQVNRVIELYEEYKENHNENSDDLISIGEYIELLSENEENFFRDFFCPNPEEESEFQEFLSNDEIKRGFVKDYVDFTTNQYKLKES